MKSNRDFKWTPELAYIVGLITTDGNLSKDGRHITFTSKDIDLIHTFCKILSLKNKIGKSTNKNSCVYRVQFSDVCFYRWLLKIGLNPKKSKTLSAILLPDIYFIDFLRGHLDGDGSITTYIDTHNSYKNNKYVYQRIFVRFISASSNHIRWLKDKILETTNINGRYHTTKVDNRTGNRMHILKFGKKDSLNLLQKIYYLPNLPSLKRKELLAKKCLSSMFLLPKSLKSPIVLT